MLFLFLTSNYSLRSFQEISMKITKKLQNHKRKYFLIHFESTPLKFYTHFSFWNFKCKLNAENCV